MADPDAKPARSDDDRTRAALQHALHDAAHMLPCQPPIRVFVHHNTLHAFQHLPFEEAVLQASERFGTEPYESEEAFAEHLAAGRITARDIDYVLDGEAPGDAPIFEGGPGLRSLRALRLQHPLDQVADEALQWLLLDGGALSHFHPAVGPDARLAVLGSAALAAGGSCSEARALQTLYDCLSPHAPRRSKPTPRPRPRDRWLARTGVDIDEWVRPLLIRLCAAFVDQGIAYWEMPGRDGGFLKAFRTVYERGLGPPDAWRRTLRARLAGQDHDGLDAERTAIEALRELEVPQAQWPAVIEATLRALPGWAGMFEQLQERPDRAPVSDPGARLVDYLAVALTLEAQAVGYLRGREGDADAESNGAAGPSPGDAQDGTDSAVVYEAFVLAQLAGLGPAELSPPRHAAAFVQAVADFGSTDRRRCWHLAYEHHHRQGVLDAMLAHAARGIPERPAPAVQALFCIDEREESLRRHIEEIDTRVETLGYAGFYGIPMSYQGIEDVRPTPLCPVVIRPTHLIREEAIDGGAGKENGRRAVGALRHAGHIGSRTAVRGSVLTAILGLLAVIPLIGRVLMPRLSERLGHAAHHAAFKPRRTRLRIERDPDDTTQTRDGLFVGFTVPEMAKIVRSVLTTCGITERLAPVVAVIGHGSSSLNNPHESAHDCGATGGGRGGPNARAFAAMANHPGVRAELAAEGLALGETCFVGGYHNTCDDAVDWYDLDLVGKAHAATLQRLRATMEQARGRDALERCRRFEAAPLSLDAERALAHVEARAAHLAEPRPEYGHATNAICVVGRRERTRGLFFDRRAFLVSYDPTVDPDGALLGPLLDSVGPVGAGINLEYYFSFVDPAGYGCGTKLPHNISGLLGVMDGHASDLRTGLPWQMVEIHEPVRLLTVIEAEPELLEALLDKYDGVRELVLGRWIQVVAWSPSSGRMFFFSPEGFVPHEPARQDLPVAGTSFDYYGGKRGHLQCARIEAAVQAEAS